MKQAINKGLVQRVRQRWKPAVLSSCIKNNNVQESVFSNLVAISLRWRFPEWRIPLCSLLLLWAAARGLETVASDPPPLPVSFKEQQKLLQELMCCLLKSCVSFRTFLRSMTGSMIRRGLWGNNPSFQQPTFQTLSLNTFYVPGIVLGAGPQHGREQGGVESLLHLGNYK